MGPARRSSNKLEGPRDSTRSGKSIRLQRFEYLGNRNQKKHAATGFPFDPRVIRRLLIENGYEELPVESMHAVAVDSLPPIHKDPFDRLLVAQAIVEGITLLTADRTIAKYSGPIQKV